LTPALPDFRKELGFVFFDEADQGLIAGMFMSGSPEHHFGEDGSEVHSFCGEEIEEFSAVGGIRLSGDNAVVFQAAEAVGENVGGDVFVGGKKFLEGSVAAHHHIADDKQGPTVAEHLDGSIERTP